MKNKPIIVSLSAALASIATASNSNAAKPVDNITVSEDTDANVKPEANLFYQAGEDLLGLHVYRQADGTVVAGHSSHSSHASHSSHSSHASSRY